MGLRYAICRRKRRTHLRSGPAPLVKQGDCVREVVAVPGPSWWWKESINRRRFSGGINPADSRKHIRSRVASRIYDTFKFARPP
jgi:hypothetical protein